MQKGSILLVEDHLPIARQVTEFLEAEGWLIDYADRGERAVELASVNHYDLVLLDLNLPDGDGIAVCARIREVAELLPPILMLTARDSFEDKARGFGEGADDYVTKPFDLRELALRCAALARRNQGHRQRVMEVGALSIDLTAKTASREGRKLELTATGFRILSFLAQNSPNPVSRSLLIHHLWRDDPPESDALKSHIYALRAALDKPFQRAMLKTITNVGYRLEPLCED